MILRDIGCVLRNKDHHSDVHKYQHNQNIKDDRRKRKHPLFRGATAVRDGFPGSWKCHCKDCVRRRVCERYNKTAMGCCEE